MKKIAITGGIGSGKSLVRKIIMERGFPVFSCDDIYAGLINSELYIQEIFRWFPSVIVDGKIDKKRLSEIVFQNDDARKRLNGIAHPLIMAQLFKQMDACTHAYAFAEVPLLFEGGFEDLFDEVIVVMRNKQNRINAVQARDNVSEEEVFSRIDVQIDYDSATFKSKLQKGNVHFLLNDKDRNQLEKSVNELLTRI